MKKIVERYEISLFGERFAMMSDEGAPAVASLVERTEHLMREISEKTATNDVRRIALMALLKVMQQLQELESNMQQKDHEGSQLVQYINQQLSSLSS